MILGGCRSVMEPPPRYWITENLNAGLRWVQHLQDPSQGPWVLSGGYLAAAWWHVACRLGLGAQDGP
jgi:hypothetical protein